MYSNLPIGQANPGLIIILIDQSQSMQQPYANTDKQTFAARAVNRCIYEIVSKSRAGDVIKNRCHVGVIGYGATTEVLVGGKTSELSSQIKRKETLGDQVLPIWVEPRAENGTPMETAFDLASELVGAWV